jgi:hypothetical protein
VKSCVEGPYADVHKVEFPEPESSISPEPKPPTDWTKAEGVIYDEDETNSALAERDYSVKCWTPYEPIALYEGYHFWWCVPHHQPLYACDLAKIPATSPEKNEETNLPTEYLCIAPQEPISELHLALCSRCQEVAAFALSSSVPESPEKNESIESGLVETRQLFPELQIIASVRDCGDETTTPRGTTLEYSIQVGMNGEDFVGDSLSEAMQKVRQYHASLDKGDE